MTEAHPLEPHSFEPHGSAMAARLNWLRAGVLGVNDSIVSTAGLVVQVAGATSARGTIFTAGLAGLVAGAVSMPLAAILLAPDAVRVPVTVVIVLAALALATAERAHRRQRRPRRDCPSRPRRRSRAGAHLRHRPCVRNGRGLMSARLVDWSISLVGLIAVLLVLHDIFHTLGHPGTQGRLSKLVLAMAWRTTRGQRASSWTGPLAMLAVIGTWGLLAIVGWALIYFPHLPAARLAGAEGTGAGGRLLDAFYISLVTISTLGLGDAVPVSGWLRVVNPLEASFGFALLTVAVSWVLQVDPALARRRALAVWLHLLNAADAVRSLGDLGPTAGAAPLERVSLGVVGVRIYLSEYAETCYFREDESKNSLAAQMAFAAELAENGLATPHPEVRLAARVLQGVLDDLATVLDDRYLHVGGSRAAILDAYAADHGRDHGRDRGAT